MLGYDVPLGGPVSRRTALRFENVQAGVSRAIETDVNLSSAKSAFAPFGRTGRGSPRQGSVGRAILGNIHKAKFKGDFGLVNTHYPEIDGVATVDSVCTENLIRVDIT